MSTGQTLLVTIGLVLFTIFVLTVYRTTTSRFAFAIANEALITGSALAQSLIEEITQKSFDEKTVNQVINTVDSLTLPSQLGPDVGETNVTLFDDVDDYKNYIKTDSLQRLGQFISRVIVYYVQSTNTEILSSNRTFFKKIDILVTNSFIKDTIKMFRVIAY